MASLLQTALGYVANVESLHPIINRIAIDQAVGSCAARPNPYSLWSPAPGKVTNPAYVTWPGLTERSYTGRHLPPKFVQDPPDIQRVLDLLWRPVNGTGMVPSSRTTTLFCFFAQWFTDGFLRTVSNDRRLNTSNHEIDLCEVYGLTEASTTLLREHDGGRLKVDRHAKGDFPPRLMANGAPKPEFAELGLTAGAAAMLAALPSEKPELQKRQNDDLRQAVIDALAYPGKLAEAVKQAMPGLDPADLARRVDALYATGVDRGSNTILYAAFTALFIREHNRIAKLLADANPKWDDDRLFETARNINIVLCLKLVVDQYINHLAGVSFFSLDRHFAEGRKWYRTNRIDIEFDLLYRWHPMIPDSIRIDGKTLTPDDYRWNNPLLETVGIEALFNAASTQPAGRMQLHNTPRFMQHAEAGGLQFARDQGVQPFNAYRKHFGLDPYETHDELTQDPATAAELRAIYPNVDDVEFSIGLLAEHHGKDSSFGRTMFTMVAVDAFSQIFTNPLLASNVYQLAVGATGDRIIRGTNSLQDVVDRNLAPGATRPRVSFRL